MVDELVHTPPLVPSLSAIVAPLHKDTGPAIGKGNGFTVMVFVADEDPHVFVTVYIILSIPATTPVTKPHETVAFVLLVLHAPPATISVKAIDAPTHTLDSPVIMPAEGSVITVIVFIEVATPHEVVTL